MSTMVEAPGASSEEHSLHLTERGEAVARLARSRWTRWGLPALAVLSALAAAAALGFPTLSNWYAGRAQHSLGTQLDDPTFATAWARGLSTGRPVGRIQIPAIGVNMVMVQGVDAGSLAKGPGHYPGTPMPCTDGNAGVAGHRTTFLHPFYDLNELKAGDQIRVSTPGASCTYVVSAAPFVVSPSDVSVLDATPGQFLITLTTCTPRGSAAKRLVVRARMLPQSLRPAPSSVKGNAA